MAFKASVLLYAADECVGDWTGVWCHHTEAEAIDMAIDVAEQKMPPEVVWDRAVITVDRVRK